MAESRNYEIAPLIPVRKSTEEANEKLGQQLAETRMLLGELQERSASSRRLLRAIARKVIHTPRDFSRRVRRSWRKHHGIPDAAAAVDVPPVPLQRPVVLMVDSGYPRIDRDSGSVDAANYVKIFQDLGYQVVFAAHAEMAVDSSYRRRLEEKGVLCIAGPRYQSLEQFLKANGNDINVCFLSRVDCGGRHMEAVRQYASSAKVIFNTVDLHHLREERAARLINDGEALDRAFATREREFALARLADATIVVSHEEERRLVSALPGALVTMIPLMRSAPGRTRSFSQRQGIGFIGGYGHRPNVDAVNYFLDEIWPLIREELPDAQFLAFGSDMPASIKERGDPGFIPVGYVNERDLAEALENIRLMVAPLRFGAGAKGKVAQALAHGVPCIASQIAAEGMGLVDGETIIVGGAPPHFATKVIELYNNEVAWTSLSEAGHRRISECNSIAFGGERLRSILSKIGAHVPDSADQVSEPAQAAPRQNTVVIVDSLRSCGTDTERNVGRLAAESFLKAGWRVAVFLDADDSADWPNCSVDKCSIIRSARPLSAIDVCDKRRSYDIFKDFVSQGNLLRSADLVIIPSAELVHLEAIFNIVPNIQLTRPLAASLIVNFMPGNRHHAAKGEVDADTLTLRLSSYSPFQNIYLTEFGEERDLRFIKDINANAPMIGLAGTKSAEDIAAALVHLGLSTKSSTSSIVAPAINVQRFAPLALVVSALWGKVGSTAIFNAQLRHLLSRGFAVARIYVDEWPQAGELQKRRIEAKIQEDQEGGKPHFSIVFRRDTERALVSVVRRKEFQESSPVRRVAMLLEQSTADDFDQLDWLRMHSSLAVVNHLQHVAFTKTLTDSPLVLETHDIYSQLLTAHGIPSFASGGPDSMELRMREEREGWQRADLCLALTEHDQVVIAPHTRDCRLARPYVPMKEPSSRSWPEIVYANGFDGRLGGVGLFDMMLWGSNHANNVASITWFFDNVVPQLKEKLSLKILIAGRVTGDLPQAIRNREDVFIAGFVDNLADLACRSRVLVIPDQGGTGRSIKLLDAFTWGACFASTVDGFRGVDSGTCLYRPSKDAAELGNDIARLLLSKALRLERKSAATALYHFNCSLDAYSATWDEVLQQVVPQAFKRAQQIIPVQQPESCARDTAGQREMDRHDANIAGSRSPLRLSVVVCTHNRYGVLPDALASLLAQKCPEGFLEIIVVDNSPNQQEAAEYCARYRDEPTLHYLLEPIAGLSNARNRGLAHARADIVAYIDDDAFAAPDWAVQVVAAFDSYGERAGVVGGRITPRWASAKPAWLPDEQLGHLSIVDWGGTMRKALPSEWLAGCNIAFDKNALAIAGGFSTALGRKGSGKSLLSNEDTDVVDRIHAQGRDSVYAPEARVEHVIDPSRFSRSWFRRRAAWQAVSDFLKNEATSAQYGPIAADNLRRSLDQAALHRQLGIHTNANGVETLSSDMNAAYDLVIALLAGADDVIEEEARIPTYRGPKAIASIQKYVQPAAPLRFDKKGRRLRVDRVIRRMVVARLKEIIAR